MAKERAREIFARFDHVAVAFSGGKDSTAVLHIMLEVAAEIGYDKPLDVVHYDEEAMYGETVKYVSRIAARPDVSLRRYCIPFTNRNACSKEFPKWYPWAPEDKHLWVRDLPEDAITELAGFDMVERPPAYKCNGLFFPDPTLSYGLAMGIRAQESLRRYRVVAMRTVDNWIAADINAPHIQLCKPIYDWTVEDVWTAPAKFGWDHNHTYDQFARIGTAPNKQRVCPAFAEEPARALWEFGQIEPALWEKMIKRVPGAATAARYARTPLYAHGDTGVSEAEGSGEEFWQAKITEAIAKWPPKTAQAISERITSILKTHNRKVGTPIPDRAAGGWISWERLYTIAVRGDLRRRKETISDAKGKNIYDKKLLVTSAPRKKV